MSKKLVNKQKPYKVWEVRNGKLMPVLCDHWHFIDDGVCEQKHEAYAFISVWNSMFWWKMQTLSLNWAIPEKIQAEGVEDTLFWNSPQPFLEYFRSFYP